MDSTKSSDNSCSIVAAGYAKRKYSHSNFYSLTRYPAAAAARFPWKIDAYPG
jgi:hypothetical protein